MNSPMSNNIPRTATHQLHRFGRAVLLSGLALVSVLLIAQRGETQTKNKDRVHTAIVTCECPDAEQACHPLVLDSSLEPTDAVDQACDPDNSTTTCARCLRAVATQISPIIIGPLGPHTIREGTVTMILLGNGDGT